MKHFVNLGLAAAITTLFGCSPPTAESSRERFSTRSTSQAIVNGTASVKAQDYVVLLTILKDGKMIPWCTGTLIAKNLVITARHCVGDVNADDTAIIDFPASKLAVYTGVDANRASVDQEPAAHGKKTFDSGSTKLDPDVALVTLDKALDLPTLPIRLESGAVKGESLGTIGYGITQTGEYPGLRQERKGLTIARIGPAKSTFFDLIVGEFQFGEAACSGDSGGPAISTTTGALIGIASRVDNGTAPANNAAERCIGTTTEDIYTDLTPAKTFIQAAFAAAGAEPWIEGEPSPEEKAAAAAAQAAEDAKKKEEADRQAAEAAKSDEGCSIRRNNSSTEAPRAIFASALLMVVVVSGRRRRRQQRTRRTHRS